MQQPVEGGIFHQLVVQAKAQPAAGAHPQPAGRIFLQALNGIAARLAAGRGNGLHPPLPQAAQA